MAASKLRDLLVAIAHRNNHLSLGARSLVAALANVLPLFPGSRFPYPPAPQLALDNGALADFPLPRADQGVDDESGAPAPTGWRKRLADLEVFTNSIWFAVPKRKSSYSRKRKRQLNPVYAERDIQHFYPCPKCTKGLVKLRHHLCPCDQEKMNFLGIRKVTYASMRKADGPAAPAKDVTDSSDGGSKS